MRAHRRRRIRTAQEAHDAVEHDGLRLVGNVGATRRALERKPGGVRTSYHAAATDSSWSERVHQGVQTMTPGNF
jgi:hypothetical protein